MHGLFSQACSRADESGTSSHRDRDGSETGEECRSLSDGNATRNSIAAHTSRRPVSRTNVGFALLDTLAPIEKRELMGTCQVLAALSSQSTSSSGARTKVGPARLWQS